ncbi:GDSL Lipase/Acylhydrolase family protein [Penicillium chermesinum]|uniref:GDSL Lipase/Acylhydrolase family protein n=1 Tax=Penicillium chermesinum TaxID=63820 RepID=A0A9W9P5U9_9EURO|nr:GDSL Lipase/Acylhydrolase family protein [Penicillium chermesinum]KAJ5238489.1 GDSL Lipase/Acylhydrolase family protein [Penicillium chermesinum]KAJ6164146.1 GDSL Lipase/Acylhydrolase family protein [Penicillium chermesinum]
MTATSEDTAGPYAQFILFGDSITQMSNNQDIGFGFHPALQEAYSRKLDIINRGFSGYTTAHAIQVFPRFFPSPEVASVRLMTVFFGANDAAVPGHPQHVPLEQYKENLKKIIQHPATRAQGPRILIITPPPVNEYQLEFFDKSKDIPHPSRTAAITKTYAQAAKEVAAALNVPVVDIWSALMGSTGWQEGQPLPGSRDLPNDEKLSSLFLDGLHLTPAGYRIVYDQIIQKIADTWPDQHPDQLRFVFPSWVDAPK